MMNRAALLLAFAFFGCGSEPVADTGTVDSRAPIRVAYVGAPELSIRERADDAAPVIATYQNGEAVSVLADRGAWVEVRSGDASGWVKAADLTDAAGKEQADANPEPKFEIVPMPVSAPSASGSIYIRAKVNADGEITSTEILENTTGNAALAEQNAGALKSAKFYPLVVKGERRNFEYFHRVSY
jgi:uncharacterized protein YgiM (DUF1202 family)